MARKYNFSSEENKELYELIKQYEAAKAAKKQLYLDGDQLADMASKYADESRYKEAQEIISYGLSLHPDYTDLMIEQAYLYLDTMQTKKAREVAAKIAEEYGTEVKLLRAEIMLSEGEPDKAEEILLTIERPYDIDTLVDILYLYMDMGYTEEALRWVASDFPEDSDDELILAVSAECYHANGQLDKARFYYNKALDKSPYNPAYWTGLAKCYFAGDELEKAVEASDFALAADETYGEAHVMRAHGFLQLENTQEAIKEYRLALQYKSLPPEFAYMFIGLAYISDEEWEQGYNALRLSFGHIEAGGNDALLPELYVNMALALSKMSQFEKAHEMIERCKDASPADSDVYLLEGRIYLEEKKIDLARKAWAKAIVHSPEVETFVQVAKTNLDYNQPEEALFYLKSVCEKSFEHPNLNYLLAYVYMLRGDAEAFCKYNKLSDTPFTLQEAYDIMQHTRNPKSKESIDSFIREVEMIQNGER